MPVLITFKNVYLKQHTNYILNKNSDFLYTFYLIFQPVAFFFLVQTLALNSSSRKKSKWFATSGLSLKVFTTSYYGTFRKSGKIYKPHQKVDNNFLKSHTGFQSYPLAYGSFKRVILHFSNTLYVVIMTKRIVHHSLQKWVFDPRSFNLFLTSYRKSSLLSPRMNYTIP